MIDWCTLKEFCIITETIYSNNNKLHKNKNITTRTPLKRDELRSFNRVNSS
jgi:hypothetical protein